MNPPEPTSNGRRNGWATLLRAHDRTHRAEWDEHRPLARLAGYGILLISGLDGHWSRASENALARDCRLPRLDALTVTEVSAILGDDPASQRQLRRHSITRARALHERSRVLRQQGRPGEAISTSLSAVLLHGEAERAWRDYLRATGRSA
ncbi:MAG: hypothetical protein JHD16_00355 [Solirubrobacteraceae bacterium]|nr:hypothetical protein [Solirubrobacteraceae bacterium]